MVKYSEVAIQFYALVENGGRDTCRAPLLAYALFRRFGIPCVKIENIGSFTDLTAFYGVLEQ
jgi:hypothetical protein